MLTICAGAGDYRHHHHDGLRPDWNNEYHGHNPTPPRPMLR
ncbi:hypothetical protein [Acetobacter orleanensis]|nr:hypothetical protein [Acetobacter orleanensis]